ncbi:MAG TPA: 30S ribosomal protein S6 [Candidatus Paceibacterota bacterium]|mgnify:CR=1 FL=1|nr:30S ribosomal protein S6 [Candidatus Paceibacterota bacterium]HPT18085.1 30S ribosomal protein S6 [Candidatus Paceibacterota bacterium]
MQEIENNDKNESLDSDVIETEERVYEVGYLLVPTLKEEEVPAIYGNLKELISSFGGKVISDEMPTQMNLAYQMQKVIQNIHHKYDTAYFGWMKFFMDPSKVLELKKKLDLDPNIIRFLTLKTIKENTIASKRFVKDSSRRKIQPTQKEGEDKENTAPINKEEIDKEIDAMIAN